LSIIIVDPYWQKTVEVLNFIRNVMLKNIDFIVRDYENGEYFYPEDRDVEVNEDRNKSGDNENNDEDEENEELDGVDDEDFFGDLEE